MKEHVDYCDLKCDGKDWIAWPLVEGRTRADTVWACAGCNLPQSLRDAEKLAEIRARAETRMKKWRRLDMEDRLAELEKRVKNLRTRIEELPR